MATINDTIVSVQVSSATVTNIPTNYNRTLLIHTTEAQDPATKFAKYSSYAAVAKDFKDDTIVNQKAKIYFMQDRTPDALWLMVKSTATSYIDALAAASTQDDGYFNVTTTTLDDNTSEKRKEIVDMCKAVSALGTKIATVSSQTQLILEGKDGTLLKDLQTVPNTIFIMSPVAYSEHPDMATSAKCLSAPVGSENWFYRSIAGIKPYSVGFSTTNAENIVAQNGNYIYKEGGNVITMGSGKMTDGQLISNVIYTMYLKSELQNRLIQFLIDSKIILIDDNGLNQVRGRVDEILASLVLKNIIRDDYTIKVSRYKDLEPIDISSRKIPVTINLKLQVSMMSISVNVQIDV